MVLREYKARSAVLIDLDAPEMYMIGHQPGTMVSCMGWQESLGIVLACSRDGNVLVLWSRAPGLLR